MKNRTEQPEVDSAVLAGKLQGLLAKHLHVRSVLEVAELAFIDRWQAGEVTLTGKHLQQALQIVANHEPRRVPAGPSMGMPETVMVPLEKIVNRLQGLDEDRIRKLAISIGEVGLLQPIGIAKESGELVYGRHRVAAFRLLGRKEIPAVVIDLDADRQALATIEENLRRRQLTPLEEAEMLAEGKEIYDRLHPEAKARGKGGGRKSKSHDENLISEGNGKAKTKASKETPTFTEATAAATGKSRATVARQAAIGRDLSPEVKAEIRGTALARNQKELAALAKVGKKDKDLALSAAKAINEGVAKTVAEAITEPESIDDRARACAKDLASRLESLKSQWQRRWGSLVATADVWAEQCALAAELKMWEK
jgi:ParB family chromosome partitioning protein